MTISIPDLTVAFAGHLPDDVTEIRVGRDGPHIFFYVAKGDAEVRYLEGAATIELAKYNVGVWVAERVHAAFAEYERERDSPAVPVDDPSPRPQST